MRTRAGRKSLRWVWSGSRRDGRSKPRAYAIEVEFLDKGGARIERGIDFIGTVQPGQAGRWQQDNYTQAEYKLGDCKAKAM